MGGTRTPSRSRKSLDTSMVLMMLFVLQRNVTKQIAMVEYGPEGDWLGYLEGAGEDRWVTMTNAAYKAKCKANIRTGKYKGQRPADIGGSKQNRADAEAKAEKLVVHLTGEGLDPANLSVDEVENLTGWAGLESPAGSPSKSPIDSRQSPRSLSPADRLIKSMEDLIREADKHNLDTPKRVITPTACHRPSSLH